MKKNKLLFLSLVFVGTLTACGNDSARRFDRMLDINRAAGAAIDVVMPEKESETEIKEEAARSNELLLNRRYIGLNVGGTEQLRGIARANSKADNLSFKSNNENFATVDANGLVTAVAQGNTTIEVTDNDNPNVKVTIPIYVMPTYDKDSRKLDSVLKKLNALDESGLVEIVDHELYEKRIYKNGKLHMYSAWDQNFVCSYPNAYFRLYETDGDIRTTGGAMTFKDYEWLFYTNEFYDSYTFHNVGGVKTYYVASTVNYWDEDLPRSAPMLDVLDNMFTSGRGIFERAFSGAKMDSFLEDAIKIYSNVSKNAFGTNGEGSLYFDYTVTLDSLTADQEDESNFGIPFGTPTPTTYHLKNTVLNNEMIGYNNHGEMTYSIGDDQYLEVYDIDHYYERITDENRESWLVVPNKDEYKAVDYLFDI